MSGNSGVELGAPRFAKEYDENAKCTNCGHLQKNHKPGCNLCTCTQFRS